ncbi:MAG: hypothetical protein IJ081_01445 [Prevotella sp.]|nr:hypothetical protein [Prevotella sp.]
MTKVTRQQSTFSIEEKLEAEYKQSQGGRNAKRIEDIALAKVGYYLPDNAHFDYLLSLPESANIPKAIKEAMESILPR